jgi:RNA polymerase sigma factor (sigma-70 family)
VETSEGVFSLLFEADWGHIGKSLLVYARRHLREYYWRCGGITALPNGNTEEDLVQHVIEDALSGKRKYDPNKGALLPWLEGQLRSEMNNLVNSAAHLREVPIPEEEDGESVEETLDRLRIRHNAAESMQMLSLEELLIGKEKIETAKLRLRQLVSYVRDDHEVREVVCCFLHAFKQGRVIKPRDIAEELEIPIEDVRNRLKRLRRRGRDLGWEV